MNGIYLGYLESTYCFKIHNEESEIQVESLKLKPYLRHKCQGSIFTTPFSTRSASDFFCERFSSILIKNDLSPLSSLIGCIVHVIVARESEVAEQGVPRSKQVLFPLRTFGEQVRLGPNNEFKIVVLSGNALCVHESFVFGNQKTKQALTPD